MRGRPDAASPLDRASFAPTRVSSAGCTSSYGSHHSQMNQSLSKMYRPFPRLLRASVLSPLSSKPPIRTRLSFIATYKNYSTMSDLFVELTAPNGRKYKQPRGLFIHNEFVKSKSGETITSVNPRSSPIEPSYRQ